MRRAALWRGALVLVVLSSTSCGVLPGGGGDTYRLTAHFDRAVSLYEESDVRVMGLSSGKVVDIIVEDDGIRVELEVDSDVPVPADVRAAIVPLSLIGERNVALFPPWTEGEPRARDGDVIPLDRTEVPVEPDEALQAFTDLARGLDGDEVGRLIERSADALEAQGQQLNDTIGSLAGLTGIIAEQDERLLGVARDLNQLAGTLNERDEQLGRVIDGFATATDVLSQERQAIAEFLAALGEFSTRAGRLIDAHADDLTVDLARLARLLLALDTNLASVEDLVRSFPITSQGLVDAYRPEHRVLVVRVNMSPAARELFAPLHEALGVPLPQCLGGVDAVCQEPDG